MQKGSDGSGSISVGGLDIAIVRKPIKHTYLRVRAQGVVVSAPAWVTDDQVRELVADRWDWICASRLRVTAQRQAQAEMAQPDRVVMWGRAMPIVDGGVGPWGVAPHDGAVVVTAPATASPPARQAFVHRWLLGELAAQLDRLMPRWQAQMGVYAAGIRLRTMTSRWGSCNQSTRMLTFNTELVHADPALLEYVVVHELAHLIAAGHGPDFQVVMDAHLPDWHDRRRRLRRGVFDPIA